jgi:Ca2+-binding EF-hand superfamily protein
LSIEEIIEGYKMYLGEETMAVHEGTKIFEKADLNKNGYIDFSEFIAASLDINELTTKTKLQTAF